MFFARWERTSHRRWTTTITTPAPSRGEANNSNSGGRPSAEAAVNAFSFSPGLSRRSDNQGPEEEGGAHCSPGGWASFILARLIKTASEDVIS